MEIRKLRKHVIFLLGQNDILAYWYSQRLARKKPENLIQIFSRYHIGLQNIKTPTGSVITPSPHRYSFSHWKNFNMYRYFTFTKHFLHPGEPGKHRPQKILSNLHYHRAYTQLLRKSAAARFRSE